ncbi:MAG: hypothetical protein Q9221_000743 [Calogaya cf. arnoldii]
MTSSSPSTFEMPISPSRAKTLTTNLTSILTRITNSTPPHRTKPIRLVAVSKLKPANDILALHSPPTSHLHFGENYLQELQQKAELLPRSVKWHFIGALQSNKWLMTIGAIARSRSAKEGEENEDFVRLREVRDQVVRELGLEEGELELSMGMSEDFESAVRCGSDEVRVGSTIFGERPSRKDAKVKDEVDEGGK